MEKTITIVSGLPRSGTSMTMKMLGAGGMEIISDNIRKADEDNPQGYFELEKVKGHNFSWLNEAQGKVFKMISMLLYRLPAKKKYKILFMERNIDEILSSQKHMLIRNGRNIDESDDEMKSIFSKHLTDVTTWIKKQNNIEMINVNYNDIMNNPLKNANHINQFLEHQLDLKKMIKVVNKSLYRQKAVN